MRFHSFILAIFAVLLALVSPSLANDDRRVYLLPDHVTLCKIWKKTCKDFVKVIHPYGTANVICEKGRQAEGPSAPITSEAVTCSATYTTRKHVTKTVDYTTNVADILYLSPYTA